MSTMRSPLRWLSYCVLLATTVIASPIQFCYNQDRSHSDVCLALSSTLNSTTGAKDLALHISSRFPSPRTGWAAFGIGSRMAMSLMFVMYPGATDNGVTVSIRTTTFHMAPSITVGTASSPGPIIEVTRTWVNNGIHNAHLKCYDCQSWNSTEWDMMRANQTWIWATNYDQETGSSDPGMKLRKHRDFGKAYFDMAAVYDPVHDKMMPEVAVSRVPGYSTLTGPGLDALAQSPSKSAHPETKPDAAPASASTHTKPHHKHSAFGLVSIHGFLLTVGFLILTAGVLAIRSGLAQGFRAHWMIQAIAGGIIVVGYLLGVVISFKHGGKFGTVHQLIGLLVVPVVSAQGLLGYMHHINFVKYGGRTRVSDWHVWVGRGILVVGNVNALVGLVLSQASGTKFYLCFTNLSIQIAVLVPMWYFWSQGQTLKDAVTKGELSTDYQSVEQEAFIVDDELDEEETGTKENVELKHLGRG